MSITVYRLPTKENKLLLSFSVCRKQTEVCRFRFPYRYVRIYTSTTNFRLHNKQMVNRLRKIAWASVLHFPFETAAYIYIYIDKYTGRYRYRFRYEYIPRYYIYIYIYIYQYVYIMYIDGQVCWNNNRRLPFFICWLKKTNFPFPFPFAANKWESPFSVSSFFSVCMWPCVFVCVGVLCLCACVVVWGSVGSVCIWRCVCMCMLPFQTLQTELWRLSLRWRRNKRKLSICKRNKRTCPSMPKGIESPVWRGGAPPRPRGAAGAGPGVGVVVRCA
jgi:hypothetical protein